MKLSRVKEPSEALPKCPPMLSFQELVLTKQNGKYKFLFYKQRLIFESILNLALPGEPNIFEIDDKKCGR